MLTASSEGGLSGVFAYSARPPVSVDFNHEVHSNPADATLMSAT